MADRGAAHRAADVGPGAAVIGAVFQLLTRNQASRQGAGDGQSVIVTGVEVTVAAAGVLADGVDAYGSRWCCGINNHRVIIRDVSTRQRSRCQRIARHIRDILTADAAYRQICTVIPSTHCVSTCKGAAGYVAERNAIARVQNYGDG